MSLPEDIRVNVPIPFPTLVLASGPIAVSKSSGIWSVGFSFNGINQTVPLQANWATDLVLVWDSVAKTFITVSMATLASPPAPAPTYDTAAGTYNVTSETVLLINKAVPAASNIQLPTAASRLGVPIIIKDYAGNAAANVATILPNGAEKIDGLASLPINSNYGGFKLIPIATGGWYISP